MITIDRSSTTPVHEQLTGQLRFLIASGQYQMDETLPSTRGLADEVGVSFHTVRKAYQQLETEGLLEARKGSGYVVLQHTTLSKSERMERGAATLEEALHGLVGLGLKDGEIEYLFQEQFQAVRSQQMRHKLVFAAVCQEYADICSDYIASSLQQQVVGVALDGLNQHQDADVVMTPYRHVRAVMQQLPRSDVQGVDTTLPLDVLEDVARLSEHESVGLVTHQPETIQPFLALLRERTAHNGQVIAASMQSDAKHLSSFVDDVDLVLGTPACRRRLKPLVGPDQRYLELRLMLTDNALDRLRERLPR